MGHFEAYGTTVLPFSIKPHFPLSVPGKTGSRNFSGPRALPGTVPSLIIQRQSQKTIKAETFSPFSGNFCDKIGLTSLLCGDAYTLPIYTHRQRFSDRSHKKCPATLTIDLMVECVVIFYHLGIDSRFKTEISIFLQNMNNTKWNLITDWFLASFCLILECSPLLLALLKRARFASEVYSCIVVYGRKSVS